MIVFEHPLKMDKTIPAILMGILCWTCIALANLPISDHTSIDQALQFHLGQTSEILIFLLGAMTIVELVDLHKGFNVITNRIHTRKKITLLWTISWMTFFLSAVLDNLTTTIVMLSLIRKLMNDRNDRLWYASFIVIASNAGGAWTPIGDVTTTMLWIDGKVSALKLIENLALPSLLCLAVPLILAGFLSVFKGSLQLHEASHQDLKAEKVMSSKIMLIAGVSALLFVPVFKTITHLPPWTGMMIGLAFVWIVSEIVDPEDNITPDRKHKYSAKHALSRIELPSILFFLGILTAINALESIGILHHLSTWLDQMIPSKDIIAMLIGVFSAVIDNVPLVAAAIGMYDVPMDAKLWHFIAFSAGTGGSMLIIGSAAGVAAMGIEKIDFIWYLKKISWLAALGFIAGCLGVIAMDAMLA